MTRYAFVRLTNANAEIVARYLPSNYRVTGQDEQNVYIAGEDNAGWTLDGYVIPRLGSGLIVARETFA